MFFVDCRVIVMTIDSTVRDYIHVFVGDSLYHGSRYAYG